MSAANQLEQAGVESLVCRLRRMALAALARMYRPQGRHFAVRLRIRAGADLLEGVSRRYTAIALIGLAGEDPPVAAECLAGQDRREVCGRLLDGVDEFDDLGEVALAAWAARALDHPNASKGVDRLKAMAPAEGAYHTVELAWSLAALVVGGEAADRPLADAVARRVLCSFEPASGLSRHCPPGARRSPLRSHVSCFADLVYPIHALSHYHAATGSGEALEAACRCADPMCQLQGPHGQWWWHYDVRTGRVIEPYPVYAVHQDAMAPMALFALHEAGGPDHVEAIVKGLQWLADPPEVSGSLVDAAAGVIWRKVARHEPGKLVRGLQAGASRLHPALRVPGVDFVFRPTWVDYQSRPYHMGWVLYAWPAGRATLGARPKPQA